MGKIDARCMQQGRFGQSPGVDESLGFSSSKLSVIICAILLNRHLADES